MASHIALNEAGVSYTPVSMSFDKGDFSKPEFLALNPMGAVPVLELDDGRALPLFEVDEFHRNRAP